MNIYLVIRDYPHIFQEIERAFLSLDMAHSYIEEAYPYMDWYENHKRYYLEGTVEEGIEDEENYYVLEKLIDDSSE